MYFNYSHFATADEINKMNASILGNGRKIAAVIGRASAINRWIITLSNCDDLEEPYKAVRWTYEDGVAYIYYWGNIWGWRALKRRMEEMQSPDVTVTSIIDWELASMPMS